MSVLCSLKNLTLTYPNKNLLNNVTLTINQGDRIGLLGLNGHGKSSLMKVLASIVTPDTTTPPFVFDKGSGFSYFYIPQELPNTQNVKACDYFYEFYPVMKKLKSDLEIIEAKMGESHDDLDLLIEKQTKIYEKLHELGEDTLYSQYLSYLKSFEVQNPEGYMHELSGGEQRKVALSLGLSAKEELILWDEPTNHLDLDTIEFFEDELQNSNKTFIIISHDRSLLNNVVDKIFHIERGKLRTFDGTYSGYLSYLQEEESRRAKEIDRLNNNYRRETAWIRRGAKARRTKSKKRIADYADLGGRIKELQMAAHKTVSLDLKDSGRGAKMLVQFEDVSMKFKDKNIFSNLDFKIHKGDKIALMGANGVGKSTLLNLITKNLTQSSGKIHQVEGLSIGFFSQKREALKDSMTPWQLIGEGSDFIHTNTGERRHVASYLESFLFSSEEMKRPISTFSGGEKNRLQLALFMKDARDLWIFDEPTNDLDLETIGILEEELKSFQGSLILVCHDRAFIDNVTNKCWWLFQEKLHYFADLEQAQIGIEILELESKLREKEYSQSSKKNESSKISNKEKQRLVTIQLEIEENEKKLNEFKKAVEDFDYSSMDLKQKNKLKELQDSINDLESKISKLYQEWDLLSSL
jgi:ATP-binding cassette subfamily F protein uup